MKKLLGIAVLTGLLHSCGTNSLNISNPFTGKSLSGQDNYEIRWEGNVSGEALLTYSVVTIGKPLQMESVKSTLPKTINFSAPPETAVGASSAQVGITVRIFRNGSECGKPGMISTTQNLPDNKSCEPILK